MFLITLLGERRFGLTDKKGDAWSSLLKRDEQVAEAESAYAEWVVRGGGQIMGAEKMELAKGEGMR